VAHAIVLAPLQQAYKEFLPSILHTFGESKLTTYLVSQKFKRHRTRIVLIPPIFSCNRLATSLGTS
jgi:hypothetical protein